MGILADLARPLYDLTSLKFNVLKGQVPNCHYFEDVFLFRMYHDYSQSKLVFYIIHCTDAFVWSFV